MFATYGRVLYWEEQPDAVLIQANPVQNTWYTVLDTSLLPTAIGVEFLFHSFKIATVGETIYVRWTVDGNVRFGIKAAVADLDYYVHKDFLTAYLGETTAIHLTGIYAPIVGKSLKVEARKTTANGTGTLSSRVTYALWKP